MQRERRLWQSAVVFLIATACVGSFVVSGLTLKTLRSESSTDLWFEADVPRIFQTMTSGDAEPRSTHHPVFALVSFLPTRVLMATGVDATVAVRLVLATFSGAWVFSLFLLLRAIGLSGTDAAVFTAMGLCTAAMVFFGGVPETFLVGSLTIMWALRWAAGDEAGKRSQLMEVVLSATTLAISITNWMFGLISAFCRRRATQAAAISVAAFLVVSTVWVIQSRLFQSSEFFVGASYLEMERGHLFAPESGGPRRVLAGFFTHPMVMPDIQLVDRPSSGHWALFLTQLSEPGSTGLVGGAALAAWALLLGLGLFALIRSSGKPRFRVLVGGGLAGQLVLHLVFGNETFFYSLHWIPSFVVLAALASQLPGSRRSVLILVAGFSILAGWNNIQQLSRAIRYINHHKAGMTAVEAAERRELREQDPWPQAPVVIEPPGSRDDYDHAAYEHGGTLWPAHSAFNVAFWVTDMNGRLVATSHAAPSSGTATQFDASAQPGPRLISTTPFYRATWQHEARRTWRLDLHATLPPDQQLFIAVRGVGWKFTRIRSIARQADGILINRRWRLQLPAEAGTIRLGVEDSNEWPYPRSTAESVASDNGWAFAMIGPIRSAPGPIQIRLVDEAAAGSIDTVVGVLSAAATGRQP